MPPNEHASPKAAPLKDPKDIEEVELPPEPTGDDKPPPDEPIARPIIPDTLEDADAPARALKKRDKEPEHPKYAKK